MTEFFFIKENDWLEFAEMLASGPIICKDGVAMFDSLRVERRTNAAALSALTMHMCIMVGAENLWKDFVRTGLLPHPSLDEEKHDLPSNDWKSK